ncbi:5-formyltetrahydrofolate cyclo-ligase [Solirhodobacter olei]|uniref:5-formyltetrahydrofolate cyclo-ligase n=1 Tax=Solirhodobacter olei TaxID=2493082 RepID=UPI0019D48B99|nr:5-formyltetrahydrofolate cyclo-ligase [Solirhodobacter olei]
MSEPNTPASSPCLLGELPPEAGGLPDAETRRDVMRWRKAERARLIALRQALPVAARVAADRALAAELDARLGTPGGATIAITWPFKGEPDLRAWAAARREGGDRIVLPVVVEKGAPLIFRLWEEGARLARGVWDIPVPPPEAPEVTPDVVLSPVVGLGAGTYRLGYGGGFYDRTLARLHARGHNPRTIAIGYAFQEIPTIFPLPHDVALGEALLVPCS